MRGTLGRRRALGGAAATLATGLALRVRPAAAAAGTITVRSQTLGSTGHDCDPTEWHFVINQIDGGVTAPPAIDVTWANGQSLSVPLDKVAGKVAHYATTANLASTVATATAQIDTRWSGNFNLSHGPCPTTPPGGGGGNPGGGGGPVDPAATPELGSLALFGSGAAGFAGYAWTRLRAGRASAPAAAPDETPAP